MLIRPCPICRKPVSWETCRWRPFCSERCRTQDLAAWASGDYKIPDHGLESSEEMDGRTEEPDAPDRSEP